MLNVMSSFLCNTVRAIKIYKTQTCQPYSRIPQKYITRNHKLQHTYPHLMGKKSAFVGKKLNGSNDLESLKCELKSYNIWQQ